jgi:hypothetical protein
MLMPTYLGLAFVGSDSWLGGVGGKGFCMVSLARVWKA